MDHIQVDLKLEEYITGLVSRESKPWKMSSQKGIVIENITYEWDQVRTLVREQKHRNRKYIKYESSMDDMIWDAYINFRQPWNEHPGTYGPEADIKLSWKKFEELVDNGCFILTDERASILANIDQICPDISSVPNSPIEGDPYEIM